MRAIKIAAAALVLSGVSVPVQAQVTDLVFDSWGACNSYLKQARRSAARSGGAEAARWDSAYCANQSFKVFVIAFPF